MIRETEHKERELAHRKDVQRLKDDMSSLRNLHEATTKGNYLICLSLSHVAQMAKWRVMDLSPVWGVV
jgi:hypothetical protein